MIYSLIFQRIVPNGETVRAMSKEVVQFANVQTPAFIRFFPTAVLGSNALFMPTIFAT